MSNRRQLSAREVAAIKRGFWTIDDVIQDLLEIKNRMGNRRVRGRIQIYKADITAKSKSAYELKAWQYKVRCEHGEIFGGAEIPPVDRSKYK